MRLEKKRKRHWNRLDSVVGVVFRGGRANNSRENKLLVAHFNSISCLICSEYEFPLMQLESRHMCHLGKEEWVTKSPKSRLSVEKVQCNYEDKAQEEILSLFFILFQGYFKFWNLNSLMTIGRVRGNKWARVRCKKSWKVQSQWDQLQCICLCFQFDCFVEKTCEKIFKVERKLVMMSDCWPICGSNHLSVLKNSGCSFWFFSNFNLNWLKTLTGMTTHRHRLFLIWLFINSIFVRSWINCLNVNASSLSVEYRAVR